MPELIQNISKPQAAILKSTKLINLFLAGVGSGKSYLNGVKSWKLIRNFPNVTGFFGANSYDQLNTSTLFRIREYWKSIGIVEWNKETPYGTYVVGIRPPDHFEKLNHNFESYHNIISFHNGAIAFIGSMDNAILHSGKEIGWAFLDETKD